MAKREPRPACIHEPGGGTVRLKLPRKMIDGTITETRTLPICKRCGHPYLGKVE